MTSSVIKMHKENNTYFMPRSRVSYFQSHMNRLLFEELYYMFPPVLNELQKCFSAGGGIPYKRYEEFHEIMGVFSTEVHRNSLIQKFIPSIDGLHDQLESGIKCLDIGCGIGVPSLLMAKKYPKSEFYGFDFAEEAINEANREKNRLELKNVHFVNHDCSLFNDEYIEMFDFITAFDAIHDQAKPTEVLSGIFKMLKRGGIFSLVDVDSHTHPVDNIGRPFSSFKYALSLLHCMPVSLYFDGGVGLGTCWGRELAIKMLMEAGFQDTELKAMEWNTFNVNYLSKKT